MRTLQLFDRAKQKAAVRAGKLRESAKKSSRKIVCARCESVITEDDARTTMDGSHAHRFTNPHGTEYHIGCFSLALGCRVTGEPSMEWTWFAGHSWQIENCAHCRVHLGWRFESPGQVFHALILERLSEGPRR